MIVGEDWTSKTRQDGVEYAKHRKQQKLKKATANHHQKHDAEHPNHVIGPKQRGRQKVADYMAAIERRNRKQDGPNWVNVLNGIERYAPHHICGWVAAPPGRPGVSGLMHANGKQKDHNLEEYID